VDFIFKNRGRLQKKVYKVPEEIDNRIAWLKLRSMNVKIDTLTPKQKQYLTSWESGT